MSYSIPDGSQLLAPSVKMLAGGGGSSTLLPNSLQATDLSFHLPDGYGTAGHALIGDGLGNFSFVDLVDAFTDDVAIATDAAASNGNITMGLAAGLRQELFGTGNYNVSTNGNPLLTFDALTQQFDFGSTTYYTRNDNYTIQSQTILGAIAAANAWRVTNSTKTNDYLNLDVTSGLEAFTLGSASTPLKTTLYGDTVISKGANQAPAKLWVGSGTEVARVGGNLKSLSTVPANIVINNGVESTLISESVAANFLNEAGTQIRIKFGFRDTITANSCQFKLRVKWGATALIDGNIHTTHPGGFIKGEVILFVQTNGANPTRNVTSYGDAIRVTNQTIPFCSRNFQGAQDFTTSQALALVLVGTANSGDAIELEHASIDVVFPETTSP